MSTKNPIFGEACPHPLRAREPVNACVSKCKACGMLYPVIDGKAYDPTTALTERVLALLHKLDCMPDELAAQLHVSPPTMRHWLSGNTWRLHRKNLRSLEQLEAKVFGYKPPELRKALPLCKHLNRHLEHVSSTMDRCTACGMVYAMIVGKTGGVWRRWVAPDDPRIQAGAAAAEALLAVGRARARGKHA